MIFIQLNFVQSDYRTHVHMGSDYWVAYLSIYKRFLKPFEDYQCCQCCEDLANED